MAALTPIRLRVACERSATAMPAVFKRPARRPSVGVFLSTRNVAGPGEITTSAAIAANAM